MGGEEEQLEATLDTEDTLNQIKDLDTKEADLAGVRSSILPRYLWVTVAS